jgi:hypothetical protein
MRFLLAATLWTFAILAPWFFLVYGSGTVKAIGDLLPLR